VFRSNGYGSALVMAASLLFSLYLLLSQQVIHRVGGIRFTVFSETVATVALIGFEGYLLERNRASARKGPAAVSFQKEVSRSS
jgi:hypothetical protein